jgi:uncharacterized protein (UPF0335 family)
MTIEESLNNITKMFMVVNDSMKHLIQRIENLETRVDTLEEK